MSEQNPTLRELLGVSRNTANRTRTNADASPCVDCKRTLTILPLRYGVVSGSDRTTAKQLAPALPAHLGKKLTPKLKESRYAVRSMREGYLYVFLQRTGKPYVCEAAYRVHDNALLQPVWPYDPSLPIDRFRALGRWTITVGDPQDVEEARLLFTPDPLSPEVLDRYRDVERYRSRMQKFDLRTLAVSCGLYDDVIIPSNVDSTVAEFLAVGNAAATAMLEKQAFPPFRSAITPGEAPKSMGSIYRNALDSLMGGGGVALVLDDPIGIVQELNAWRNDAIEMHRPWLDTVDEHGLSNERKYMVAEALDDVEKAMQEGYVKKQVDEAAAKLQSAEYRRMRDAVRGFSTQNYEEQRERYDPERVRTQAEADKKRVFDEYKIKLDWPAKLAIQQEFSEIDLQAKEEMDKREVDHLAWLDNKLLEQALDFYDRTQPVWGQAFASQIALCVLGMNGCASGAAQLASWWADIAIAKRNLAWRAVTRNQTNIERETRTALDNAKAAAKELTTDNIVNELDSISGWFEKVADLFNKADAAVEAALATSAYRWFDPRRLQLSLTLFSSLHQHLFRLMPGNAADRRLLGPMLGFVHAGLGRVTVLLRMRELAAAGQMANQNRVAGQVNSHIRRVRETLTAEFQNGGGGQFYQVRAGVIMAIIEGVILGFKAYKKDDGEKEYLEYKAALLITNAAGIELAALSIQSVATRYAPTGVVGRGAAVTLGGLRLFGGSLATVGGAMLTFIDYDDYKKYSGRGYRVLGNAYLARAIVSGGVAGLAALVSLSYSGPLLRFLVGANSRAGYVLAIEALAGSRLIAVLLRLIGIGSLITLGISALIMYLAPNAMDEWIWHSCLKKWEEKEGFLKPFPNQETELQKLYEALHAVN
ncbi:T6SS effector BTH_I2691 family protein [Pseudomonas aeruginosa]